MTQVEGTITCKVYHEGHTRLPSHGNVRLEWAVLCFNFNLTRHHALVNPPVSPPQISR